MPELCRARSRAAIKPCLQALIIAIALASFQTASHAGVTLTAVVAPDTSFADSIVVAEVISSAETSQTQDLSGVGLQLSFDAARLECISIAVGDIASGASVLTFARIDNDSGFVAFSVASAGGVLDPNRVVCVAQMRVRANAEHGATPIALRDVAVVDTQGASILDGVVDAVLNVVDPTTAGRRPTWGELKRRYR